MKLFEDPYMMPVKGPCLGWVRSDTCFKSPKEISCLTDVSSSKEKERLSLLANQSNSLTTFNNILPTTTDSFIYEFSYKWVLIYTFLIVIVSGIPIFIMTLILFKERVFRLSCLETDTQ